MFTGLIEDTGRVKAVSGGSLTIQTKLFESASPGDSIAVDGSCLTISGIGNRSLAFHCSAETVSRTIISGYYPGTEVNLERPLGFSDGLHGHIVTGHVDEAAAVLKVKRGGEGMTVWISCSGKYLPLIVEKGSIAVSGISLTIASLAPDRFSVVLISETLERTTAGNWKPGSHVNLEYDIIGKYVKKQTDAVLGKRRLRNYLEQ
ncbi:MAG: riboflavin synthase [Candidatus Aegiribacteria sp.]|nr:riboflavin synthase [Candidatus Aegiribacteria sp.]